MSEPFRLTETEQSEPLDRVEQRVTATGEVLWTWHADATGVVTYVPFYMTGTRMIAISRTGRESVHIIFGGSYNACAYRWDWQVGERWFTGLCIQPAGHESEFHYCDAAQPTNAPSWPAQPDVDPFPGES